MSLIDLRFWCGGVDCDGSEEKADFEGVEGLVVVGDCAEVDDGCCGGGVVVEGVVFIDDSGCVGGFADGGHESEESSLSESEMMK